MLSFKGFIIILGLFLSFKTWNFKFDEINDSKFAALSIFNTAVRLKFYASSLVIIKIYFIFKDAFTNCKSCTTDNSK